MFRLKRLKFSHRSVAMLIITGGMLFIFALLSQFFTVNYAEFLSPWHYECKAGFCQKLAITGNATNPKSLSTCQLICGDGNIWPKPTKHHSMDSRTVTLNPEKIEINGIKLDTRVGELLKTNFHNLKENINSLTTKKSSGHALIVTFQVESNNILMTIDTDESYTLHLSESQEEIINAKIIAKSYFGARHGLETLSQLIVNDDLRDEIHILAGVHIEDKPVFLYRGLLLDSSRNFMDKDSILRTITGMGMSKLNTLHWHITDSHSFPIVSKTWPKMSQYGAYSREKTYTENDVQEIINFGLLNGVRILPEFDAPAHVGEGWQWVGDDAVVCFNADPWNNYCVEPPCGQLNPTSERMYEILEGIYKDFLEAFRPDMFHMGGDEINVNCWNSSASIGKWMESRNWTRDTKNFHKLWKHFQDKAYNLLKKLNGGKELPAILWTSDLTNEENIDYLDPKKYIIQIWTTKVDSTIKRLLNKNLRVILSNYDALYFDCGFGSWVGEGNNWCSPYKGWQLVYDNSPYKILANQGVDDEKRKLVLGAEAALWSEQVDSSSLDMKFWPRAAALAERLWTNPESSWRSAEQRLLRHRERLIKKGINSDTLQPEWCLQNQGKCVL